MRPEHVWRRAAFVATAAILLGFAWMTATASTQPAAAAGAAVPTVLQPDRCYKFTFAIPGATNWKVLEVLDAGWIKAEVDAGPAAAQREPTWINTAQLVTVRDARCSG